MRQRRGYEAVWRFLDELGVAGSGWVVRGEGRGGAQKDSSPVSEDIGLPVCE